MRKIIQIAALGIGDTGDPYKAIVALADDGTLWLGDWIRGRGFSWNELLPLPSDEDENNPF